MGITRGSPAIVAMAAALAAAAVIAPVAIASTLTVPSDTVPPTFGDVAHCHIEQVAPGAAATTAGCAMPVHSDDVTPLAGLVRDVAVPPAMQGGRHAIEWSADGSTRLTKSGISLADGAHEVTWTVTDGAGNVSTTEQVIIVEDTTPPAFKPGIHTSYTMEAETPSTELVAGSFGIVATDSVGIEGPISPGVASVKVGSHTVKWTATDAAGNASTMTQAVTVTDTTDPVIETCPSPHTVEATGNPTALTAVGAGVTATDKATATGDIGISPSLPTIALDASSPVRWTATDGAGRTASCIQLLTVRDRVAPEITPNPIPPVTMIAPSGTPTTITASAAGVSATDAVDPNPSLTPNVTRLGLGSHTVKWTARDSSLNTSSLDQSVLVVKAKFAVTSMAFTDNGVDLTFSKNVDATTTGDILISKRGLTTHNTNEPRGLRSTITTDGKVVRVVPTLTILNEDSQFPYFCSPSRADPSVCVSGSLNGHWVLSLPGTLLSTEGDALYSGASPSLLACSGLDATGAFSHHRRAPNVPGCVWYTYYNERAGGSDRSYYSTWSDAPAASSTQLQPAPLPPLQTSAAIAAGTDTISLSWTRSIPSASYALERSTDGSAFAPERVVITVNSTRAVVPVMEADLGHSLSYRVAETLNGVTARSDAATVTLPAELEAPSGLSASRSAPGAPIELAWRDAPIASGYHVEMAVPGGDFVRIATVGQGSHTVDGAAAAGAHAFRVVAYLGGAESPPSATASVSAPAPPA